MAYLGSLLFWLAVLAVQELSQVWHGSLLNHYNNQNKFGSGLWISDEVLFYYSHSLPQHKMIQHEIHNVIGVCLPKHKSYNMIVNILLFKSYECKTGIWSHTGIEIDVLSDGNVNPMNMLICITNILRNWNIGFTGQGVNESFPADISKLRSEIGQLCSLLKESNKFEFFCNEHRSGCWFNAKLPKNNENY